MVKNFFISSALVVGDAPLIDVPLMIVIFSVLGWEKANGGERLLWSPPASAVRLALTATKPPGGECGFE